MKRLREAAHFALTTLRNMRDGLRFASEMPATATTPAAVAGNGDNPLEHYFDSVTEGPGIWKWRHYFPVYHRHLAKFVGKEVHIVEIGIYSGGSLPMWLDYFGDGCQVYGVDIAPECAKHERERVRVFIGDQADPAFWERVIAEVPRIDVVIDDGGHLAHQQIASLKSLLPRMAPGGVYICEDILDLASPFHAFVEGLTRPLGHVGSSMHDVGEGHERARAQAVHQQVASLHRYPLITVLEKPEQHVEAFNLEKHGTVWQPGIYEE
jgi:SAM-dependent methyltransferase